jgi:hypothetical protein
MEEEINGVRNCCWICDDWREVVFHYLGEFSKAPAFILFKHLNWDPIYLPEADENNGYSITLMVPPTRIFYVFMFDEILEVDDCFPSVTLNKPELLEFTVDTKDF